MDLEKFEELRALLAAHMHEAMEKLLVTGEAVHPHRVHAMIILLPMDADCSPIGAIAMNSFGGDPGALLFCAARITEAADNMNERVTSGRIQ